MSWRSDGFWVYQAVNRHGSLCELEELLKHGHSPDQSPLACPPPLYRAVHFNRPDMALALLKAECQVAMNKRLEQHHSPIICLAARLKMTDVVLKLCLNPQCNVFAVDSQLQTIVHLAVANRNYTLLKSLPSYCKNWRKFLTLRDGMCLTPLHLAASLGDFTALKLLYHMDLCCELDLSSQQLTFNHQGLETEMENGPMDSQTSGLIKESHNVKMQLESLCMTTETQSLQHTPGTAINTLHDVLPNTNNSVRSKSQVNDSNRLTTQKRNENVMTEMRGDKKTVCQSPVSEDGERLADDRQVPREQTTICDLLESSPETGSVSELSLSENEQTNKQPSFHMGSVLDTASNESTQPLFHQGSSLNREPYEQTSLHKDTESFSRPVVAGQQQKGHWAMVKLSALGSKDTMLHLAASGHHLEVMQFLISHGADVNARNIMNNTPLHLLVMHGRADHRAVACARLLLNAGADWSLKGTFIRDLRKRPEKCRHETQSFQHTHREATVGMMAAIRNRVAYLKLLGEAGERFEDLDFMDMTPLMLALSHGSEEAAHYLLMYRPEQSCRRDKQGNTALHHVSHCTSKGGQLTQLMLGQGYRAALLVEDERYPSTDSCCKDLAKACVRCSRPQIYTPLTWAIRLHRLDILKTLLRFDPSLLLQDFKHLNHSPMHMAVRWIPTDCCIPFIDVLLEHGCDGNRQIISLSPYQFAQQGGRSLDGFCPFSALYLKKKLGAFFIEPDSDVTQGVSDSNGSLQASRKSCVLGLRDMCLERVRLIVKARKRRYCDEISSLPLPPFLIRRLLFQS